MNALQLMEKVKESNPGRKVVVKNVTRPYVPWEKKRGRHEVYILSILNSDGTRLHYEYFGESFDQAYSDYCKFMAEQH